MAIIVHQAICGEQNKAWELLKTTLNDSSIAKKIAFQTDLQDSPPSGVSWLPAIRGFLFGENFLIIKTYPDNSIGVRNGRVFSHCLIIEKNDLASITDLSPLLSNFKDELDKSISLQPIIFTPDLQDQVILKDSLLLRFNKIIQSFFKFTSNSASLIWVGQRHYEIAVCKLWQLLSPSQKENFNFGINFNPSDVVKDKLSFVAIPDNSENKFAGTGFIIIRKDDAVELKEFSEQFIAGEPNAISRIEAFVTAIEASKPSIKEISIIAKGISTFENIDSESDLKLLNTLSNIIAKYSPNGNKGVLIKTRLIKRISAIVENAEYSEIFLLRNFQIDAFKNSEKQFSKAIENWCSKFLLNENQNEKFNFTPFIIQIFESDQGNWLGKVIKERISSFLSFVNPFCAKMIWVWLAQDIKLLKIIGDEIEYTKSADLFLCDSLPQIMDKRVLAEVKLFVSSRGWFRLYATILKSEFEFETAIKEQLKVDLDKDYWEGIEILTDGTDSNEVIAVSISTGDKRLINISGKLCKSDTTLLSELQVDNHNWQEVWLAAIDNGCKVSDGLPQPLKIIHMLYDLLLLGKPVNESLLRKISETDFANILNYPNRNKIWAKFPSNLKSKFLAKTSIFLLESLSKDTSFPIPEDQELYNYLKSDAISTFVRSNSGSIKMVLPIFNTFTHLPENIIRDYITNYSGKLDVLDATQLGRLVNSRRYTNVAYVINAKSSNNKNFRYALEECYLLLDFITRGLIKAANFFSNVEISKDEWWQVFTELSYKLYSAGPTQNKIWTQADGKEYDLLTKATGKEIWIAALHKLRQRECSGGITVKKLLTAMTKEYQKNDELKALKYIWKKI